MTEENVQEIILFSIGEIICGLSITEIREIKRFSDITTVFGAPTEVKGVINLRGEIVTVLETRKRFGYDTTDISGNERIIIVPHNDELVGLLVDFVDDVITLDSTKLLPVPSNMSQQIAPFFASVYQHENIIVSLLKLEHLLDLSFLNDHVQ